MGVKTRKIVNAVNTASGLVNSVDTSSAENVVNSLASMGGIEIAEYVFEQQTKNTCSRFLKSVASIGPMGAAVDIISACKNLANGDTYGAFADLVGLIPVAGDALSLAMYLGRDVYNSLVVAQKGEFDGYDGLAKQHLCALYTSNLIALKIVNLLEKDANETLELGEATILNDMQPAARDKLKKDIKKYGKDHVISYITSKLYKTECLNLKPLDYKFCAEAAASQRAITTQAIYNGEQYTTASDNTAIAQNIGNGNYKYVAGGMTGRIGHQEEVQEEENKIEINVENKKEDVAVSDNTRMKKEPAANLELQQPENNSVIDANIGGFGDSFSYQEYIDKQAAIEKDLLLIKYAEEFVPYRMDGSERFYTRTIPLEDSYRKELERRLDADAHPVYSVYLGQKDNIDKQNAKKRQEVKIYGKYYTQERVSAAICSLRCSVDYMNIGEELDKNDFYLYAVSSKGSDGSSHLLASPVSRDAFIANDYTNYLFNLAEKNNKDKFSGLSDEEIKEAKEKYTISYSEYMAYAQGTISRDDKGYPIITNRGLEYSYISPDNGDKKYAYLSEDKIKLCDVAYKHIKEMYGVNYEPTLKIEENDKKFLDEVYKLQEAAKKSKNNDVRELLGEDISNCKFVLSIVKSKNLKYKNFEDIFNSLSRRKYPNKNEYYMTVNSCTYSNKQYLYNPKTQKPINCPEYEKNQKSKKVTSSLLQFDRNNFELKIKDIEEFATEVPDDDRFNSKTSMDEKTINTFYNKSNGL